MSIFGNDIEKIIFMMLTFTDGGEPPVLKSIDEMEIPYKAYFKFNNSVFAAESKTRNTRKLSGTDKSMNEMYWDSAYAAYKDFFNKLGEITPIRLTLTREVLEERRRVELTIDTLKMRINDGVNQLIRMREELPFIIEYEAERDANRNFTKTVDVLKTRKVEFKDGHYVTNCMKCNQTCHNPCKLWTYTYNSARCSAMGKDGNCKKCRNHCHWSEHCNANHVYEDYTVREDITIEDIERKYKEANSKLSLNENLFLGLSKEYNKVQKDILEAVELIRKCLERLNKIAMRPNPMTAVAYIDLLINATEHEKRVGWKQRLDQLQDARERALMMDEMREKGEDYDPLAELEQQIKAQAAEKKGLKEKIAIFFAPKKNGFNQFWHMINPKMRAKMISKSEFKSNSAQGSF